MHSFPSKFATVVSGVLCGFDRLFFRGTLRRLAHCRGLQNYLWFSHVLYKNFREHCETTTARLEEASLREAQ